MPNPSWDPSGSWTQTFGDEFAGASLDTSKWQNGWWVNGIDGNGYSWAGNTYMTAAYYTGYCYMSGGYLNLKMDHVAAPYALGGKNYAYTGSVITTHGIFSQVGGAYEARIYLPHDGAGGVYGWPAFWTLDNSWAGEMDILEAGAIASGRAGGTAWNMHWPGGDPNWTSSSPYSGWHTFGVNWDDNAGHSTFYWDGVQVGGTTAFVGTTGLPEYLILCYQMSNNQIEPPAGGAVMLVDWVRVWQPGGGPPPPPPPSGGGGTVSYESNGPGATSAHGSSSPLTWTHNNGGNALLVGVTTFTGNTNRVTAVSYGGQACSLLGFVPANNISLGGVALYGLLDAPAGANTVSVSFTGGQNTNAASVSLSGADSFGTTDTDYSQGSSVAATIAGTTPGGLIVAAACFGGGGSVTNTLAGTNGVTVRSSYQNSFSSAADEFMIGTADSAGGTQQAGFTATPNGDTWGIVATEVLPGAGIAPRCAASAGNATLDASLTVPLTGWTNCGAGVTGTAPAAGDLVVIIGVSGAPGTITQTGGTGTWNVQFNDNNAGSREVPCFAASRVLTGTETAPVFGWPTASKFAWTALALTPSTGNVISVDAWSLPVQDGDQTGHIPGTAAATSGHADCSVVLSAATTTTAGANASVSGPPGWTMPAGGNYYNQTGSYPWIAALAYRTGLTGTVAPGSQAIQGGSTAGGTTCATLFHVLARQDALPSAFTATPSVAAGAGAAVGPGVPAISYRPVPARAVAAYWTNWSPLTLAQVNAAYNLVFAFAAQCTGAPPGTDGSMYWSGSNETTAQLKADIAARRAAGTCVILTCGGSGAFPDLTTRPRSTAFVSSVYDMYALFGPFDGIELNCTENTYLSSGEVTWIGQQLKGHFGAGFLVAWAAADPAWITNGPGCVTAMLAAGVLDLVTPACYGWNTALEADKITASESRITSWHGTCPDESKIIAVVELANSDDTAGNTFATYASANTLWDWALANYPAARGMCVWHAYEDARATGGSGGTFVSQVIPHVTSSQRNVTAWCAEGAGAASGPSGIIAGVTLNSNPGFETGTSPWTAAGTYAVLSQSSAWAAAGTKSGLVTCTSTATSPGMISEQVTVSGSAPYTASVTLFSSTGGISAQWGIRWYDGSGTYLSASYSTVALGGSAPPPSTGPSWDASGPWTVTFSEDFAGTTLDSSKWEPVWWLNTGTGDGYSYAGNPSMNACMYSGYATLPGDGYLHLKLDNTAHTGNGTTYQHTGSVVTTHGKFSQIGGAYEARIYMPANGSNQIYGWPCFWVDDPSFNNEIDIVECSYLASGQAGGSAINLHWPGGNPGWASASPYYGWHTFGCVWDVTAGTFDGYWDGVHVWSQQPFQGSSGAQAVYLILCYWDNNGAVQPPGGGAEMLVDWVRVWQPGGGGGGGGTASYDASGPGTASAHSSSSPLTWTHVNNGNALLVGVTTFTGASNAVTAVTYSGQACSLLGFVASNLGSSGGVALYGLMDAPSGSHTVSVSFSGGNNTNAASVSVANAASFGTPVTNGNYDPGGASVTATIPGTTAGSLVVAAACFGGGGSTANTFTGTHGVTVRSSYQNSTGSNADEFMIGTAAGTGGTQQAGFSSAPNTDVWGIVAVEVLAGAGGGSAQILSQSYTSPASAGRAALFAQAAATMTTSQSFAADEFRLSRTMVYGFAYPGAASGAGSALQPYSPVSGPRVTDSKTNAIFTGNDASGNLVTADLDAVSTLTGITFRTVSTYCNPVADWASWESPWQFSASLNWVSWLTGGPGRQIILAIDLVPWSETGVTSPPVPDPYLWEAKGARGDYDAHYTALAVNLVSRGVFAGGQPLIIRLGIEANRNTEADWVGSTAQQQTAWAQTYARCVAAMRSVPGANLVFAWNPAAARSDGTTDLASWYPGDAYVDIIAFDAYDLDPVSSQTVAQEGWPAFAASGSPSISSVTAFAAAHGKPVAVGEWGLLSSPGTDDAAYVNGIGSVVHANPCAFQCYFNAGTYGVLPLSGSRPLSLAAYQAQFGTAAATPGCASASGVAYGTQQLLSGPAVVTADTAEGAGEGLGTAGAWSVVTGFPGRAPNPVGAKIELNLGGTWTNVTSYVMVAEGITVSGAGRPSETGQITSETLTLTLRNTDGRFTPKNTAGAYYPNIVRNCQIRYSVNSNSVTGVAYSGYRFFGEVSSWPPSYDVSQHDTRVQITASGIWRRITQSTVTSGSCYFRYVRLLTGGMVPAAYWAMEDGSDTKAFVLCAGTGTNIGFTGTPSAGGDSASFAGSNAIPVLNGARLAGDVSAGPTPVSNVIRFALSVPGTGEGYGGGTYSGGGELCKILSAGSAGRVDLSLAGGQVKITGYPSGPGGTPLFSATLPTKVTGTPVLVSVELTPSGGNIAWALRIIKPNAAAALDQVTGSVSGSIGAVTEVQLNGQGRLFDTAVGQLSVNYQVPSLVTAAAALGGRSGESAVSRFIRLCAESNIPCTVTGSASAAMGPQLDGTISDLLQTVEDTDGGMLYETRDQFGLGYRTLASMKDQSPALTIPYGSGVLGAPLEPVFDDSMLKNEYTVSNWDGYAAIARLTSGALSVQPPPNGVGSGYTGQKSIIAADHAQVNALAQQLLFQGTVDDVRFPTVFFNLARRQAAPYFYTIPRLWLGDYLQVTSLPAFLGGGTAKQLIWGYTEKTTGMTWTIEFNTIPEVPFESSFSPGVYTVAQALSRSGGISGGQLAPSSVGPAALSGITARQLGSTGTFLSDAPPYDWTFTVSGTPADNTYFICYEDQARPVTAGDTFRNSAGLGGPFTVTALDPPYGGYVNVHFTPDASSVMSTGTVYGGKNGDLWINSAADFKLEQWKDGDWVPLQFGPGALSFTAGGLKVTLGPSAPSSPGTGDLWYDSLNGYQLKQWNGTTWVAYQFGTGAIAANTITANLIAAQTITASKIAAGTITGNEIAAQTITAAKMAANTITAGQLAAGIVYSGIVDATTIQGARFIAYGTSGGILVYNGTPAAGNLIGSFSGYSGTDAFGNSFPAGLAVHHDGLILDNQDSAPAAVAGASSFYSSVAGRPRYLAASGVNAVLERSDVNVAQYTVGNTTSQTLISAPLDYRADEGAQSSEFEIEIDGIITTAPSGTAQTLTFRLCIDGTAPSGAGPVTLGAVFLETGTITFAYTLRFRLNLVTTGVSGTANIQVDGQVSRRSMNLGSQTNPVPSVAVGEVGYGKAFDSTAAHTLRVYANWGGTTSGQALTTYRTKTARRM